MVGGRAQDAASKVPFRGAPSAPKRGTPVGQRRQHCTAVLVNPHIGIVEVTVESMIAGRRAQGTSFKVPFRGAPSAPKRGTPVGQRRQHCTPVLVKPHIGIEEVTVESTMAGGRAQDAASKVTFRGAPSAPKRGTPVGQRRQHCTPVLVKPHIGIVEVTVGSMMAGGRAQDAASKSPFRGAPSAPKRGTPVGQRRQHCTPVLVKPHIGIVEVTVESMMAGGRAQDAASKSPFRGAPSAPKRGTPVGQRRQHCTAVLVKPHIGIEEVTVESTMAGGSAQDAASKSPFRGAPSAPKRGAPVGQHRQRCTPVLPPVVKPHIGTVEVTVEGMVAGKMAHDALTKVPFRGAPSAV